MEELLHVLLIPATDAGEWSRSSSFVPGEKAFGTDWMGASQSNRPRWRRKKLSSFRESNTRQIPQ
jgi:hypothetical protein